MDLYHTKFDHVEWRETIESKEKQIYIDSVEIMKTNLKQNKYKQRVSWFSTTSKYKINESDLIKVLEFMK
jgi:hypothetical protein